MSIRRLVVLAVCVALAASIATVVTLRATASAPRVAASAPTVAAPAAVADRAYAFVTPDAVVVMRGEREVATVRRLSEPTDSKEYKAVWTHDGRFLAFFSDVRVRQEELSATELVTVDAVTGRVRRVPCGECRDLTPVRDSAILVRVDLGSGDASYVEYRIVSLGEDPPTVATQVPFGDRTPPGLFLVSSPTHVVTNGYVNGAERLHLTAVEGDDFWFLGRFESNDYMPAAASDDGRFAVAFRTNPGLCGAFPIVVFGSDGSRTETDTSKAAPRGSRKYEYGVYVADVWWDTDGDFHATMAPTTCARDSEGATVVNRPATQTYRLDGHTWIPTDGQPATMAGRLDASISMVLVEHDCVTTMPTDGSAEFFCNTGTLYRDVDGNRTPVRDDVLSLSAAPRR